MSVLLIFTAIPVNIFALEDDSVTVYFYCENPYEVYQSNTASPWNFTYDRNIIVPMQKVTINIEDVGTINSEVLEKTGYSISDTGILPVHVFVKALKNMGIDPWTYVEWAHDATGLYTKSIDGKTTGYITEQKTKGTGTQQNFGITGLHCSVNGSILSIKDATTSDNYLTLPSLKVSDGDVVRLVKRVAGSQAAAAARIANLSNDNNFGVFALDKKEIDLGKIEKNDVITLTATPYKKTGAYNENGSTMPSDFALKSALVYSLEEGKASLLIQDIPFKFSFFTDNSSGKTNITATAAESIEIGTYLINFSSSFPSGDSGNINSIPCDYVIINIGTNGTAVNKTELSLAISYVTSDEGEKSYYNSDDKYNGKDVSTKGFWADMQLVLNGAITVNDSPAATQEEVNTALANLNAAIAKLISKENVNATLLYEQIQKAEALNEATYTALTWHSMRNVLVNAKSMLASLYNGGNPTEINVADYQSQVDSMKVSLEAAISGLKSVASEDTSDKALRAYKDARDLARYYDPAKMNEAEYTSESWSEFIRSRNAAVDWINSHAQPAKGDANDDLYELMNKIHPDFVYSCHFGLNNKSDSVTVSLKVVNSLAPRAGKTMDGLSGYYNSSMKLTGGKHTLKDALDKAAGETGKQLKNATEYEYLKATNATAVFINGVLYRLQTRNGPLDDLNGAMNAGTLDYKDFVLHEGDEVVFAYLQQPSRASTSGAGYEHYQIDDIIEHVKSSRMMKDGVVVREITVKEGESFTLRAESAKAYSQVFGGYVPFSGATLFESKKSEVSSALMPAADKTDVITDAAGNFSHKLYGEGWYTLALYDLRENDYNTKSLYGLAGGDIIRVRVLKTDNPKAVKDSLLVELKALYDAYDQSYFSMSDWETVTKTYSNAVTAINASVELYAARESQLSAMRSIRSIQERISEDNKTQISSFRSVLSRLPEDVSALGKSSEFLAKELIRIYSGMSEYQRNLLTGAEDRLYKEIKNACDIGLPELDAYEVRLEINADTPEAEAAIEDMMSYILINSQHVNKPFKGIFNERTLRGDAIFPSAYFSLYNAAASMKSFAYIDESIGSITTPASIMSLSVSTPSGILTPTSAKIYPDRRVVVYTGIDPSIHFFGEVSGAGWMILKDGPVLRENTGDNSSGSVAVKGKTILIGGVPYEVKSIVAEGISFEYGWDSLEDPSVVGYKNKHILYEGVSRIFIMPYDNVTVKINWGPVDGAAPGEEQLLGKAKSEAIDAINDAFDGYRSTNYDDNNWASLVNAKTKGIEEVRKASSIEQVELARDKAIAAMAAIEKKAFMGTTPFGKVVGKVDLYAENTTFSGGAFRGTFIEKEGYAFGEDDTMMTVILRALSDEGFGWVGTGSAEEYKIEYLASINRDGKKLGEFDGEPGSGWMGTLNDFFVNEGFQHFSYKNGKLEDGDEIRLLYTQNLGVDLGGTWGNSDTSLADLRLSSGKLYPTFDSGTYNYTLVMPSSSGRVKVTPTASNKNYLVKAFLNDKVTTNKESSSFYKRTRYIPVKSGDYINIGIGEYAWPSMNNQETEARNYTGSWYRLDIISPDKGADRVISLINALPSIKRIDLSHEDEVKSIRSIYNALTASEQAKVTNIDKLKEAEARIEFVRQIENVKTLLGKIPAASKVTLKDKQTVMDADAAYKKLTDEQKLYITVGDVKNYNDAIDKLTELGAFTSGSAPTKIVGSDAVPVIEGGTIDVKAETKVVNKEATSKVTDKQIKDAIAEAEKSEDVSSITIKAETKEEVTKSTVVIPKSSVTEISGARLDLKVETPVGIISIPEKALPEIARQAQGSSVEIVIENMTPDKLTDVQKAVTEGSTVYDISIISGGKRISSFGGQKITISLPYTLKGGEKAENVAVWYMNDKGELEKISCIYNEKTGLATFTTDHLSYYIVGYENKISFADVTEDDWFYEYVMYAVQKGLFSGTGENTFSPNLPMTRSMLVTVLHRLEGRPTSSNAAAFADVPANQWYTDAVAWSAEKEVVKGITATEFKPEVNITREQLAVMLYRYASSKNMASGEIGSTDSFADKDKVSSWAETAVKWAVGKGIITGRTDGSLDPSGSATRAEVAAMLQRYIENVK